MFFVFIKRLKYGPTRGAQTQVSFLVTQQSLAAAPAAGGKEKFPKVKHRFFGNHKYSYCTEM
jgi:hypothetical protein